MTGIAPKLSAQELLWQTERALPGEKITLTVRDLIDFRDRVRSMPPTQVAPVRCYIAEVAEPEGTTDRFLVPGCGSAMNGSACDCDTVSERLAVARRSLERADEELRAALEHHQERVKQWENTAWLAVKALTGQEPPAYVGRDQLHREAWQIIRKRATESEQP